MPFSKDLLCFTCGVNLIVSSALADDSESRWAGPYVGINAGYSWDNSGADFELLPKISDDFGLPRHAGMGTNGSLGGLQGGYNYQFGRFVMGPEVDWSELGQSSNSTITGVDLIGAPYTSLKSEHLDWLATGRIRVGYAPMDRLLVYTTGGVALGHTSESTHSAAPGFMLFGFPTLGLNNGGSLSGNRVGATAGAGLEHAFNDHFSLKVEYLYYDLGDAVVAGPPQSFFAISPNRSNTRFDLDGRILRLGLNYRFNGASSGQSDRGDMPFFKELQTEFGTRYWLSDGKTVKHLFSPSGANLNSELSYGGLSAEPLELFARADHTSGLFLKGNVGTGSITDGKLKDEDFPPFSSPYSSTTSSQRDGSLTYGTLDAGYNLLKDATYKLGAFAGYNYYREAVNADGCLQTAGGTTCVPALSDAIRGITNNGQWNSLRLGLNGQIMPTDKLKLTMDAAWLPYTWLSSEDTHWLRINQTGGFLGPVMDDGTGHDGYQLESVLSYHVTPAFSLGCGARYWHMETTGTSHFEGNVVGSRGLPQPVSFSTNRYGAFVEAAYQF